MSQAGAHQHTHGSHAHCHHHHAHSVIGNIRLAFLLNFGFSLIEFAGGAWIGSMAIMANAIHDMGDSVSLAAAWFLERFASRAQDSKFNFGYRRFSLLSALVSGVVITTGSVVIVYESIERFFTPHEAPSGLLVSVLAVLGLAINGFAAWRLSRGGTQNEKMLTWHSIGDMMGWAIVLIGGVAMEFLGWPWLDPLLAIALALFVLYNVFRYLKQTAYLFLQGRPASFEEEIFVKEVLAVPGIERIDHLAVWSLDGNSNILSARLHLHSLRDPLEIEKAKIEVRRIALQHGAISTLETCLASQGHEDAGQ